MKNTKAEPVEPQPMRLPMLDVGKMQQDLQNLQRIAVRADKNEKKFVARIAELTGKQIRQETVMEEMNDALKLNGEQTDSLLKRLIYATNLLSCILARHPSIDFDDIQILVDSYIRGQIKGPNKEENEAKFRESATTYLQELNSMLPEHREFANNSKTADVEKKQKEKAN